MAIKFKKVTNAAKQKKMWDHLIIGNRDFEECGDPWDEWNTKIIPERKRKLQAERNARFWKMMANLDANGDGVVNSADAPKV